MMRGISNEINGDKVIDEYEGVFGNAYNNVVDLNVSENVNTIDKDVVDMNVESDTIRDSNEIMNKTVNSFLRDSNEEKCNETGIKEFCTIKKLNSDIDNKLDVIPPQLADNGSEVFFFEEEKEGKDPDVLPIWVKLTNVPMEGWTKKGISTLASCQGRLNLLEGLKRSFKTRLIYQRYLPIIMNSMTTQMCNQGVERVGLAKSIS
ncbi:hypothetical protein Tco_1092642 [Tanacetum coccineum]|uniref:DUF4283 domain-containing protein n=1 Tax=Tanacetum coccineum TaxID=301880 RepID=A0ABQ5IBQ3_9ASTR